MAFVVRKNLTPKTDNGLVLLDHYLKKNKEVEILRVTLILDLNFGLPLA
jgi:hypothetical protein